MLPLRESRFEEGSTPAPGPYVVYTRRGLPRWRSFVKRSSCSRCSGALSCMARNPWNLCVLSALGMSELDFVHGSKVQCS